MAGDLVGAVVSVPGVSVPGVSGPDIRAPGTSASGANAVILRDLILAYEGRPAVYRLSGALAQGSLTAIVGPNGAGKSTLLKGIVGLMRPSAGAIEWADPGRGRTAYLPQHGEIERRFPISVFDTVLLGHWRRIGWTRAVSAELCERARRALAAVGLGGFERHPIGALSAGQLQRVLFARLMVQDADLILLDEPFGAVDWRTSEDLLRVVEGWHRERRTIAAVLHDLDQVRAHFPQTLLLARQCIAWGPTGEVLTRRNLLRVRHLSADWAAASEDGRRVPA